MPTFSFLKASVSIAEKSMLKRVGARTQPCFTPFVTGNGSEEFTIVLHSGFHAIVEKTDNVDDFFRAPKLRHDFPKAISVDSVESLSQVNKCDV